MFDRLIVLIGLQRCGTHAIGNWLMRQRADETLSNFPLECINKELWAISDKSYMINNWDMDQVLTDKIQGLEEIRGRTLLVSVETGNTVNFKKSNLDIIDAKEKHVVWLLRDARNCFASFVKQHKQVPPHILDQWKTRAETYLGITKQDELVGLPFIWYDKWFADEDYRREIAESLNLVFTDYGKEEIPNFGCGSSFTGLLHDGEASKMDVLNRYNLFENDPWYNCAYSQVKDLNEKLLEKFEKS